MSLGFSSDRFNELSDVVLSLHTLGSRCATNKYFQIIGSIHDIESYFGIDNTLSLNVQIFFSHWGHLAIIFVWVSRNLFHIANGNYDPWVKNPIGDIPIGHHIWDPHFSLWISDAYSSGKSDYSVVLSYSGIYNQLYTLGFNSVFHLYKFIIICQLLAVISIPLAKVHLIYLDELLEWLRLDASLVYIGQSEPWVKKLALDIKVDRILIWPAFFFLAYFDLPNLRLNFQSGIIIGSLSIGWCAHLVHLGIPISRNYYLSLEYNLCTRVAEASQWPTMLLRGSFVLYSTDIDKDNHIFDARYSRGQAILTLLGGLKSNTISLYLTDIAHHHLALGIVFLWSAHVYLSLYKAFGHYIRDVFFLNAYCGGPMMVCAKSSHLHLGLALAGSCVISRLVAQEIYSLTPYLYLSYDYITSVANNVHHSRIASFKMMATFAHGGIFLIRDYT